MGKNDFADACTAVLSLRLGKSGRKWTTAAIERRFDVMRSSFSLQARASAFAGRNVRDVRKAAHILGTDNSDGTMNIRRNVAAHAEHHNASFYVVSVSGS